MNAIIATGSLASVSAASGSHRKRRGVAISVVAAVALGISASPAGAQSGAKPGTVATDAYDAVTQPLTDLKLRGKDIPPTLRLAQSEIYDLTGLSDCQSVNREIMEFDAVLGPDADEPAHKEGTVNKGLKIGGSLLAGLIPFRGLVRELSGANAEQARWEAAVFAGVARRSFLKGYAKGLNCFAINLPVVQTAREDTGFGR